MSKVEVNGSAGAVCSGGSWVVPAVQGRILRAVVDDHFGVSAEDFLRTDIPPKGPVHRP
jgi:hypothetical protein